MKPYGQHKPFKGCQCIQCGTDKKAKDKKKAERRRAKNEIKDEISKMGKKPDMSRGDS